MSGENNNEQAMAATTGSWQKIPPIAFLNLDIPDDEEKELPVEITMENVVLHLPKSLNFNKLEGSEDWIEIPFGVLGQAYVNLIPVFANRNEAGI